MSKSKKSQKRQAQKYAAERKEAEERIKNLTPQQVNGLEDYVSIQILYANDMACNAIKFLGDKLKTIPYKSKGAATIYGALMKRVNAYMETVNNVSVGIESLATMFGEMDEYNEKPTDELCRAIDDVFAKHGVEHHEWVAQVETALILTQYAVTVGVDYINKLNRIPGTHPLLFRPALIVDVLRVMENFERFVSQAAHLEKTNIDLNKETTVTSTLRKFNKTYFNSENFIRALSVADEENNAEGRMKLMQITSNQKFNLKK